MFFKVLNQILACGAKNEFLKDWLGEKNPTNILADHCAVDTAFQRILQIANLKKKDN